MYRRGDVGQVARALRVLDQLRGYKRGRWVNDIATALDASERTVRRDIEELQDGGIDIEITKRANRVYALLIDERSYTPVSITKRERFTLLAVRRVFDAFNRTPLLDDVVSVLRKLEQRMSAKERADVDASGEQFVYMPDHGTKSYEGKEDIIDAIQSGIVRHKLVRYRYGDGRGRGRAGFLAPYRLAMYRHGLYVVGARLAKEDDDVEGASLGVFAIERFYEAEFLRARTFDVPNDARIREVLDGSFGPHLPDERGPHEVVLEFTAERAHLVSSREWHPSQQISRLASGTVRVSMRVPSLAPIVSWVLEWGPHARVVAPPALADLVVGELTTALKWYQHSR